MAVARHRRLWSPSASRRLLLCASLVLCGVSSPRAVGAEPLVELRLRALRWSEKGGVSSDPLATRAPRLLRGVGGKALVVDCPPGVEPRRLAIKETSTLVGPFSRARWRAGRWFFAEARVGGVVWALDGPGCRISYQQRRLLERGFSRLEWRVRAEAALRSELKRLAPFESSAQRWLEDAKSPSRWIDRYRLVRPAPALGALRRDPSLPGASRKTLDIWMDREGEDREWLHVKSPRFIVSGPARVDIRLRRLGSAPALCLHVDGAKSCQLTPDAKAPLLEKGILRQPAALFAQKRVSIPASWRVLLPRGKHRLHIGGGEALVKVRGYTLSRRWGLSGAAPEKIVIYAPGAVAEEQALEAARTRAPTHWRMAAVSGHESEDLLLMLPAQGPVSVEDWRWLPLKEQASSSPANWIDESHGAALWLPQEKPCALFFGAGARWVGAPRSALNHFVFTGAASSRPPPRVEGCRAWLRVRGRRSLAPSPGELVLRRFTRVMAGPTLELKVAAGSDVSALDLSWPAAGARPVALVAELQTGELLRFTLGSRLAKAGRVMVLAADRARWSAPERFFVRAEVKRLHLSSTGTFAVRVSSRAPGVAPAAPQRMVELRGPQPAATLEGLRDASRRVAAAPRDTSRRLGRASLLEAMGLPQLAASDYLWVRLDQPQDLAYLASRVARISARALFGADTWRPVSAGWLPWVSGAERPSSGALELARREDYLALLALKLGDGLAERVGRWRRAILGGQVLDERQRLAAYRILEQLPAAKRRASHYWPLRALSRWVAISLVKGQARLEKRQWPLDRHRDAIAPYRDALFPQPWPAERAARLTFGREIVLPARAHPLSLSLRCLQRRPEAASKGCVFEVVDEKRRVVLEARVPGNGTIRALKIPPLERVAYLRIPEASSALQQVLLPPQLARPLLQHTEQRVHFLATQKTATLALLGPTTLRLRARPVSSSRGRLEVIVSPFARSASSSGIRRHTRTIAGNDVEVPIEHAGPVRVTLRGDVALRFRAYLRVARASSLEPLSDRLFAAKLASKASAPVVALAGREGGAPPALAARPIQKPAVTLSGGLRFGAEEVAGDPQQKLYPQLAIILGMATRPWPLPLFFDLEGRAIFGEDAPVMVARAGFDWYPLRGRTVLSLTGDVKLAHGSPAGLDLTSLSGALRMQAEYWLTPRIRVLGHLRYVERDALSGGKRAAESGYGRVSALWSAYRQDHPRALSGLAMGRLVLSRYLRYGLYAWFTSNASTDQALIDHLGLGTHLDAVLPSLWARLGADFERRAVDAHRAASYASPEIFARAGWTIWPAGYLGLQVTASARYQFHFDNLLLTLGFRGFLSRDRSLRDLRPSRTLYKPAASWWQDGRADGTYGSAQKGGGR